jgi:hypothetical protein
MKYFYAGLGVVLLVGIAYASYTYGKNKDNIVPANNTVANNTVVPDVDLPVLNDGNPNVNVEAKTVAITSPKNGAVVVGDVPFSVSGTVSPNATKMVVKAYATVTTTCGIEEVGCNEQTTENLLDEYTLSKFKLGDTKWSYAVSHAYGNAPGVFATKGRYVATAYFTDGATKSSTVNVTYTFQNAEMGKPVIYLYPTKTQLVSVNVKPTSGISYTEPEISATGWQVTANPDGTLIDMAGKVWPYLFWEGYASNFVTPKEGFVVAQGEVGKFFDTKLATLGLNAKEIVDFKEFWIPKMADKPYYFVTFIPQNTFDKYAPLTVNPNPQTVIRVFFDYKGLDAPMVVPTQILPKTPERIGFTVVEWGGRLYR